uniref:Diacylglycerol O-acyltransferase 1-2-like n=1 Tax=Dermatophagoides pteronyssinus TaxID=6956 RepID=A0A6P6YIN5_DERPT|nr:diacylglycerol O-acyltransferase 1-2-like [Dermatophagoides pteronyssinus]
MYSYFVSHFCAKKQDEDYALLLSKINSKYYNYFLLVPTLLYDTRYKKSEIPFRASYFLKKSLAALVCFASLICMQSKVIGPTMEQSYRENFLQTFIKLMIPIFGMAFLVFFFIFENLLNALAELCCFADRRFYEDWWNSASYSSFGKKWNTPVYIWLRELCETRRSET